ncbi:MAG: O-antigen ligase family protein [Proteobacteria bacterium]|nr:O-antigen ligase family protein [Pseudomonadota bacterium]
MVFVRPIEQFAPDLMAYRPLLVLWGVTFLASLVGARRRGGGAVSKQHFCILATLSLTVFVSVAINSGVNPAVGAFGVISTPVMLFVLTCLNVDSIDRFRKLSWVFLASVVALVFQGLAAYHFGIDSSELVIPQLVSDKIEAPKDFPSIPAEDMSGAFIWRLRSVGFLNDPNDFAQTIVVVAPWVLMGFASDASWLRRLLLAGPWLATFAYVLSLTHSRGGMLGAGVALLFFFRDRISRKLALLGGVAAIAVLAMGMVGGGDRAMSGKEQSASERIDAWNEGIQMLKGNPVFGVGYDNFTEHHVRTAHNSFVLCFAELGLLGYFLWMGLIVLAFKALNRITDTLASTEDHARYAVLLRTSMVGFLVCAWFLSRTFVPTLFILMGMTVGLLHAARQAHPASEVPELHQPLRWKLTTVNCVVLTLALVSVFIRFSR